MPVTQIAVFVSANTKVIRGILVPEFDDSEIANARAPQGEIMFRIPANNKQRDFANRQYVIDQVTARTGTVPPDPVCAVVANGVVENMIRAEETETLPGKVLIEAYSPEITMGCIYDAVTKLFTVPAKTIPATTDRLGHPVAAKTIPAKLLSRV